MDEAEEACCQALDKRPSCTKARFRRGQARLALGRPIEAAADFGEVCVLEPNNAEATRMLRRAQEEGHQAPQPVAVETRSHDGAESETPSAVVAPSTSHSIRETPLPPKHTSTTTSPTSSGNLAFDEPGEEEKESRDAKQNNPVQAACAPSPPSVPSFMVPGWLTSAEREQGWQAHENGHLDGDVNHGGSNAGKSGEAQDAVSVSRLVSQISAAQKAGSKTRRGTSPSAPGTIIAAAAQAEWSHMQLEEASKVQESLRRWSANSSGGAAHPAVGATTKTIVASVTKGKPVGTKRGGSRGKATKKGHARVPTNTKEGVGKASDWWADLEEEESKLREAFRAKLSIGDKLPTRKKTKETEKDKTKRKKKAASRLRSDVPP